MNTLSQFQDRFARALHTEGSDFPPSLSPAFAIYRNTAMRGCIDALEAGFPSVACLVGREWFRAASAVYIERYPPRDTRLLLYGDGFADFLDTFAPTSSLPYLADVARLDRAWTEAHVAADAEPLTTMDLASVPEATLATLALRVHPATRWHRSAMPSLSIWGASRQGMVVSGDLVWRAECALIVRVEGHVIVEPVEAAACTFLDACREGLPFGEALVFTADAHPQVRLDLLLSGLLQSGAFARS